MWLVPTVILNVFVHTIEFTVRLPCSDMVSGAGPFSQGFYSLVNIFSFYSLPPSCVFTSSDLGSQISFASRILVFAFSLSDSFQHHSSTPLPRLNTEFYRFLHSHFPMCLQKQQPLNRQRQ